jgi:hypothetical protein
MEPETRSIVVKREEQLEAVRHLESQLIYESKTTENVKNVVGLNSSVVLLSCASSLKIFDTASRTILLDTGKHFFKQYTLSLNDHLIFQSSQ